MTIVELYDNAPIENIISSLTTVPDKIIFIGDGRIMGKFDHIYRTFFKNRDLDVEIAYKEIGINDINVIVDALSEIVETEEECVFNLNGGYDLILVAMGIVYQKYKDVKNIQMQRFNIRRGEETDCDNDGIVFYTKAPEITVEENIQLHGGAVRYQSGGDDRTFKWDLSEDFMEDVEKMWSVCRTNPGLWNSQLRVLKEIDIISSKDFPLDVSIDISAIKERFEAIDVKYISILSLLKELAKNRLIYSYSYDGQKFSFSYKNEQVKKCLIKEGTVLELKVLVTAKKLQKDGQSFYTDFMNGVYIDWDGEFHSRNDEKKDTENEIDVVLMKGILPIFISCKNGKVEDDELYKLDAVTDKFGGQYAKKVLIATYLGKKGKNSTAAFRQRAKDMKINLVDGVHELTDGQFSKMVKHLINS